MRSIADFFIALKRFFSYSLYEQLFHYDFAATTRSPPECIVFYQQYILN
jgi:hypothetical protein